MVVHCAFSGLVPFGIYSLFIGDGNSPSRRLRPLDGSGENNSFEAPIDGTAAIDVHAARSFSPSDVVVLVFHADGYTYGSSPGRLGYDALEQLVARISYALGMNAR